MSFRQAFWILHLLLLLAAPVVSTNFILLEPHRNNEAWLVDTVLGRPADNQSVPLVCDYSHQAWAQDAIRFKINGTQFKTLVGPEPCAQSRRSDFGFVRVEQETDLTRQIGHVLLPFREYVLYKTGDLNCKVSGGTFIRNASSLYAVVTSRFNHSALDLREIMNRPALKKWNDTNHRFYVNVSTGWLSRYVWPDPPFTGAVGDSKKESLSYFSRSMPKENVPEYLTAINRANSHMSIHQERVRELSPSNTAILLLPMLLSFVPASALTNDLSAYRTLIYAIATDFLTNIPVFIKGVELLHIDSLQGSGTGLSSLITGDAQVRFVEIWFSQCSNTPRSFMVGFAFVFFAIWSVTVGFTTEFLVWKFNAEKRRTCLINSGNHFALKSLSRSAVFEKEDGEPSRKRLKVSQSIEDKDASRDYLSDINFRKRRHADMVSEADSEFGRDDNDTCDSNRKENVKEHAFFVVGVALSFVAVLPFLGLAFLRHPFFKKTKQRERFFMIGTIVGAMNIIYIFLSIVFTYYMYTDLCFLIFVLLFDLVLPFFLGEWKYQCCTCLPMMSKAEAEPTNNEIQESRETRFYLFGLLLGLLLSVLSPIYLRCFPWVRGYKRRRGMLKIGCMIGAFNNFLFLALILRTKFFAEIPILLFNLVFIETFLLLETDVIIRTSQDELPDMTICQNRVLSVVNGHELCLHLWYNGQERAIGREEECVQLAIRSNAPP